MDIQKGAQCKRTCQAEMVVGSNFTSIALLVCLSGTVHPQSTVMNLQGHKHDANKSRPCSCSVNNIDMSG